MKTLTKTILAVLGTGVLACAAFAPQVQATPISGSVNFTGGATFNGSLAVATEVFTWSNTIVQAASGDFTTTLSNGIPATFAPNWIFVNATPMLWTAGGFTFDLNAGATVSRPIIGGVQFLIISGTGTISSTNTAFDPTPGIFSFTTQNPSSMGIFSFSAGTASVPDGGSAVALLGVALAGVEILRRKLRVA